MSAYLLRKYQPGGNMSVRHLFAVVLSFSLLISVAAKAEDFDSEEVSSEVSEAGAEDTMDFPEPPQVVESENPPPPSSEMDNRALKPKPSKDSQAISKAEKKKLKKDKKSKKNQKNSKSKIDKKKKPKKKKA